MIIKLLKEGYNSIQTKEAERNDSKVGFFRGGSCGCYTDETFYGTCPRKALFRFKGFDSESTFEDSLCFVSGVNHEENLVNLLLSNPKIVKVERWDMPNHYTNKDPRVILHDTSLELDIDGISFSGRPDIVFTLDTGERVLIEAKSTISEDKSKQTTRFPLLASVCQASMYRQVLDCKMSTYVVYGSYATYGSFEFKRVPDNKRYPALSYRDFPKGTYVKIPCGIYQYQILFGSDGKIHVKDSKGVITETPLTSEGVIDFYKQLKICMDQHVLPNKRQEIELYGKPKYSDCEYCDEFKEWCKSYDTMLLDYDEVIEGLKIQSSKKIKI